MLRLFPTPRRANGPLAWARVLARTCGLATTVALALLLALGAAGAQAAAEDVPVGTVVPWGGTVVPAGWLRADGSAVSRTTYAELFAAIGTTYGAGDGSTTFNLPDLRQRFPLGQSAAGTGSTLGATGGQIDHTHSLASHTHTLATAGAHTHDFVAHTHGIQGHRHTGFFGISMTAGGSHNHTNGGGRDFLVVNGATTLYNLATGAIEIDQRAAVASDGDHSHAFNGNIGNTGSGNNGDGTLTTNGGGAATTPTVGGHDHGAATGSSGASTNASNPAFLAVDYLIKVKLTAAPPCGAIWGTARSTADAGALLARGAAVSRATESTLFGCLSTTFGVGDGSTTFNLPNLQGRFALGKATAGTGSTLGGSGGSLDHTHDASHSHTVASDGAHTVTLPAHAHNAPAHYHSAALDTTTDGAHNHNSNQGGAFVGEQNGGNWRGSGGTRDYDTPGATSYDGPHNHDVDASVGNSAGPLGNSAMTMSTAAAVTSPSGGAGNHGGSTSGTTSATTTSANPAFQSINWQLQSSASTTPAVGTIVPFAGSGAPPAGWKIADGSALDRTQYAALFAAMGTAFGPGDGSTTFNLPDLRGRFALGQSAAGTGSTLGGSGGSLDHGHVANHGHSVATDADHVHSGLTHTHTMPGHYHDFSKTFGSGGNHQHGFVGGGNFWGTHITGGAMPVTNVLQGGSRNAAHVAYTDTTWGSHRHTSITGTVGQSGDPTGNAAVTSNSTDPGTTADGSHTHVAGSTSPAVGTTNPPYLAVRYMIRVTPATIIDNQGGDATWRNSNSGSYDVDFSDPTGLARFEVQVWSGADRTGTMRQDWTQVSTLSGTSATANWSLPASTWAAMVDGTNYVSVRMWTTADAQSATLVDAFYVNKDTAAAAPTGVLDGPAADIDWWTSTSTWSGSWTASVGEAAFSGVLRYEYCLATGAGCTGTIAQNWTTNGLATVLGASGLTLVDGTNYTLAVRMVDVAGNTSAAASSDGATIDAQAPLAPTLVSPPDGSGHLSWPALTATYLDPAPGSAGQLTFNVCSVADCSVVTQSGTSAAGIAPGANGSWTPTAANATYWWRVKGTDSAGTAGPWSAIRQVQVGSYTLGLSIGGTVPLGTISPGVAARGSTTATVSSNANGGYQLLASDTSDTIALAGVANIADWTGTVTTPSVWATGTTGYAGVSVIDATGGRLAKWGTGGGPYPDTDDVNNRYAGLTTVSQLLHQRTTFGLGSDSVSLTWRFTPATSTLAGAYSSTVTLTVVGNP